MWTVPDPIPLESFDEDSYYQDPLVIPAGEWVLPATSSANRDPAQFPDPDRLDLGRDTSGHVAFGHGVHHCLGAPLARMEAETHSARCSHASRDYRSRSHRRRSAGVPSA